MQVAGHIRKRGENYQIIIEFPPDAKTGKRNRKYKTLKNMNKKQAEKALRELIREYETNTHIEETTLTVGEWIDEWYKTFKEPTISQSTRRGYDTNIRLIKASDIAEKTLQGINTIDIQAWINEIQQRSPLTGKKISAKTVKNIYNVLNPAMKRAEDLELIRKNPCRGVSLPKCAKYEAEVYDDTEIQKLLEACKGTELELPITLAVTLGLRRGELLALRWENVDLDNMSIKICENMIEVDKETSPDRFIIKEPKSASGIRTIKITNILANLLKKQKVKCLENKLAIGDKYCNVDYVVCKEDGKNYLPNTFDKMFKRLLKNNGLKDIRLHDLRHTNATLMLKNGISAKEAQLRLGHADVSVTLGTYSHVLSSMEETTANKIEQSILMASG